MSTLRKYLGLIVTIGVLLILVAWPIITGKDITRETTFTILLSVALASSLNILLGYTGYVSFGHVVFFGLGGYVGFYLMSAQGMSLWISMLAGGVSAGVLAFLLGKAILRLRGGYFALATIGINEAMRAFINNFEPFGGPVGMTLNFSVYRDYGGPGEALWLAYYVLAGLTFVVLIMSYLVRTSKFGLGLLAIREDEDAAEVMGVNAPNAKTWAYVLSAIIPGMLGVLFFFKNGSIEPAPAFRLHFSIEMIVMVMLGGQGTVMGPILGAYGYQSLRGFLLTSPIFKDIQLAVAGALLLVIVLFVPAGVVGWLRNRVPVLRRALQ
ncbi:MAG: branched-chain amino acid ABC transporter permease [Ardenticatenaceae bacterium]|nr:branched-chain amino acid ABC transporter permease [Anaerolineales bacterium]MCB8940632.1 branched-chain amino acid ABC transporter permease [Ardenticatenaceae bacterium]MCB8971962.1 branched-chain amino acid ABC transporter permease [Ardenticatenaceae bacterium]